MSGDWRCAVDGPVWPLHVAKRINREVVEMVRAKAGQIPIWCPWPPPMDWLVTGVGWVGDEGSGAHATVTACSGPSPVEGGPADILLIAEEPGVGLGARFAGIDGIDPGELLAEVGRTPPHAKVRTHGWPMPLWNIPAAADRSVYVGEAMGLWLYAVAWPASAGWVYAEDIVLHDLVESVPDALVYGAPSPYLHDES